MSQDIVKQKVRSASFGLSKTNLVMGHRKLTANMGFDWFQVKSLFNKDELLSTLNKSLVFCCIWSILADIFLVKFLEKGFVLIQKSISIHYSQGRSSVPPKILNEFIIWKMKPLVVPVTGVKFNSAFWTCVMSSEYVTRTSLYLDRLKIFEWMKFLRIHLHQIQGSWAVRHFPTAPACEFMAHYACKNAEMSLKSTSTNGFNFLIIKSLMESCGVRLTCLDCKTW